RGLHDLAEGVTLRAHEHEGVLSGLDLRGREARDVRDRNRGVRTAPRGREIARHDLDLAVGERELWHAVSPPRVDLAVRVRRVQEHAHPSRVELLAGD